MSYEMTQGLAVVDRDGYAEYRREIRPLLEEAGGRFRYDFDVAGVVHNEDDADINRAYVIQFPDRPSKERFFADPRYLEIRRRLFEPAVKATVVIAEYPRNGASPLANRLDEGARALASFADALSVAEWRTRVPGDGRTIGVIVHHVASMYPVEIRLALELAGGQAVTGVTWNVVHAMNAAHAREHEAVSKETTLDLLRRNSAAAAAAIRSLSDEQLAQAAPISLYGDASLTCQFMLEDHAVRHSYHHLARLRATLAR